MTALTKKLLFILLLIYISTAIVGKFFYGLEYITGHSMAPEIQDTSLILISKSFFLKENTLNRGEIYIVQPTEEVKLVKRLIGLPGDKIWIEEGQVFLNGSIYKSNFYSKENSSIDCRYSDLYEIPEGRYFFLGDNLCDSYDSRFWGTIPFTSIVGQYVKKIF